MKSSIQGFATSCEYVPKEAIVFYQAAEAKDSCTYATHHQVRFVDGKNELGPATSLTARNITDLAKKAHAGLKHKVEVLPENVLFANEQGLAWWMSASVQYMSFDVSMHELAGKERLQGVAGNVPCPALVFILRRGKATGGAFQGMQIFALTENQRPTSTTVLARAPLLNVGDNGEVCWGDGSKPRGKDVSDIPAWQALFFSSVFTHYNGSFPIKCEDPYDFIAELLKNNAKKFPKHAIKVSKTTLGQALTAACGA